METIKSQSKRKPKRLGKMSSTSWNRAAETVCSVLTERLGNLQIVQTLTLDSSSVISAGVLALLEKLVPGVNAFGIHEFSSHYGEAVDEFLYPMYSDHMRLIVWSENKAAVSEFCELYAALVGTPDDWVFNLPVCRKVSIHQAIEWIATYAKSPVSNYEGKCDPEISYEFRPKTADYGADDIYKSPCYRWREKRRDLHWRTADKKLGDFILAHGDGVALKDEVTQNPKWP